MPDCGPFRRWILEDDERSLDARDAAALLGHLAACASCRAEAEGRRRLDAMLGALEDIPPGPGFAARVRADVAASSRAVPQVAAEPARTLDDKIDRSKVGNKQVKVEIERLLDDLRGDDYAAGAICCMAVLSESAQDVTLDIQAVSGSEARVE